MKEIIANIENYLTIKEIYKRYNKENLYDVFNIFKSEVTELNDIVNYVVMQISKMCLQGYSEEIFLKELMYNNEENLVNEIADVILTVSRLIKEFKLEEPLIEMMQYKVHRQLLREEKNKNE